MESYLNKNFGGVKAKHSSDEALRRWRKAVGVVKNPKRRFRYTANLDKRPEAAAMKRSNRVRTSSLVKRVLKSLLFMKMESYLNENFGGVKAKHSSDEALRRWRKAVGVVKNPKRRFRYTANLDKRSEAAAMKRSYREKLRKQRVAKAALQFIHERVPDDAKAAGFGICAEELGSIVESHDLKKLKSDGGVEGLTSIRRCGP